jgi:hypothetical protein
MSVCIFLLSLGAATRLTRLAVEDTIGQPFRDYLERRATKYNQTRRGHVWAWLVRLFECPWCAGLWLAAGVTALAVISHGAHWFLYPAIALTISYLIGVVSTIIFTIEEM